MTVPMLEAQGAAITTCAHEAVAGRLADGGYQAVVIEGVTDGTAGGLAACRGKAALIVVAPGLAGSEAASLYQSGADAVLMEFDPDALADSLQSVMGPMPAAEDTSPPDGGAPAEERAGIDTGIWEGLETAVGPDAFGQLLAQVDADIAAACGRIAAAMPALDLKELREATHILVAVAGAVGATSLQAMAERLNRAAHDEDAAEIAATGNSLMAEGERVLAYIRARCGV